MHRMPGTDTYGPQDPEDVQPDYDEGREYNKYQDDQWSDRDPEVDATAQRIADHLCKFLPELTP